MSHSLCLNETTVQALDRWSNARRPPIEAGIIPGFFERSISLLPEGLLAVARFGLAGGTFALVTGNYFLACANTRGVGMAALDTVAVAYRMRPFVFESAAGPAIFADYPLELAAAVATEDRYWKSYTVACEILLGSRQGRSPLFLTSRSREPLSAVVA